MATSSWTTFPQTEPPRAAQELAARVEADGGHVLAVYREPVGEHWQIFCLLPLGRVEASPYQRDLSPTHVKRLTESVKKLDRFVDPVVALSPSPGVYWTPNGNHRRTVLTKLKADYLPAILVVEPEIGYQILPLNVEKAHNLKEKSLEVIRMYRGLAGEQPTSTEEDWAFQFESAHFITLGLLYETNKRFAGGAFAPILRRVDKFLKSSLRRGLEEREERAELVRAADEALGVAVAKIKKRGINHPYVKNYVLARTTPLTRARKTLPSFEQTFRKLREAVADFDVGKVRYEDIQRSAIMAIPAAE
jgi:ParB family transcriptional regulator, chromosome partitioning protein